MRLSDLMRMEAFVDDGRRLGNIDDVRLRVDVQADDNAAAGRWFIEGFLVGRGAIGNRLGYDGEHVEGPTLLSKLMRRLSRRARFIPYGDSQVEPERLVFRGDPGRLLHPSDLEEDPP